MTQLSLLSSDGGSLLYQGNSQNRMCPGRHFANRLVDALVRKYVRTPQMLENRCSEGTPIIHGVSYRKELVKGLLRIWMMRSL